MSITIKNKSKRREWLQIVTWSIVYYAALIGAYYAIRYAYEHELFNQWLMDRFNQLKLNFKANPHG
jgi:hypothetical protein